MSKWIKVERDDSKRTCRNCGYEHCRNIVVRYGWHLDSWIEEIAGFAWRRTCARWEPAANERMEAAQ
jgi:hypothetical protein